MKATLQQSVLHESRYPSILSLGSFWKIHCESCIKYTFCSGPDRQPSCLVNTICFALLYFYFYFFLLPFTFVRLFCFSFDFMELRWGHIILVTVQASQAAHGQRSPGLEWRSPGLKQNQPWLRAFSCQKLLVAETEKKHWNQLLHTMESQAYHCKKPGWKKLDNKTIYCRKCHFVQLIFSPKCHIKRRSSSCTFQGLICCSHPIGNTAAWLRINQLPTWKEGVLHKTFQFGNPCSFTSEGNSGEEDRLTFLWIVAGKECRFLSKAGVLTNIQKQEHLCQSIKERTSDGGPCLVLVLQKIHCPLLPQQDLNMYLSRFWTCICPSFTGWVPYAQSICSQEKASFYFLRSAASSGLRSLPATQKTICSKSKIEAGGENYSNYVVVKKT